VQNEEASVPVKKTLDGIKKEVIIGLLTQKEVIVAQLTDYSSMVID
jgi:hypothetical protein